MQALQRHHGRFLLGHPSNCSSLGNVLNVLVWSEVAVASLWMLANRWEAMHGGRPTTTRTGDAKAPVPPELPVEAHLQVTAACALPCPACHIDPSPSGPHVPLATLVSRLQRMAAGGVRRVALGGGEALLHPELPAIVAEARALGLSLGLTTSGLGIDEAKLSLLTQFSQVNVSLDGLGDVYRDSRGYRGDETALATLRRLSERGIRCGINLVLSALSFATLEATAEAAIAAGAQEVQVLRYKPVGRGAGEARALGPAEAEAVWPLLRSLIQRFPGVLWRGDCALIPFLADQTIDPARAQSLGLRGCHGGEAFFSVDPAGVAHPCSFVRDELGTMPGAFGASPRWAAGVTAEPCRSCSWQPLCRGGCHAVAMASGDSFAPDPECPRVLRWKNGGATERSHG